LRQVRKHSQSFWPYGDVEAGHVTIVLANLLGPGVVGLIPIGHFALVQSNAHPCDKALVEIPIAYVTRD